MTFHELYTGCYSRAFRFVKSYVNDSAVAEDIVAESMIAVWKKYDCSREDTLLPFLYTVLRNRSLDYLKSLKVKLRDTKADTSPESEDIDLRLMSLSDTTEDKIFSTEINEIVARTLAQMPQRTREIFNCSRVEGKSYFEISQIFHISDKGVAYHIGSAVKLLRIALKDYLGSPLLPFLLRI